jgi:hypothetical protein
MEDERKRIGLVPLAEKEDDHGTEAEKVLPLYDENEELYQELKKIMPNGKFIVFYDQEGGTTWSALGRELTKSEAVWGLKMIERRVNRVLDGNDE